MSRFLIAVWLDQFYRIEVVKTEGRQNAPMTYLAPLILLFKQTKREMIQTNTMVATRSEFAGSNSRSLPAWIECSFVPVARLTPPCVDGALSETP
jgi:hypothetical protein